MIGTETVGGVACYIRSNICYNMQTCISGNTENIFIDFLFPKTKTYTGRFYIQTSVSNPTVTHSSCSNLISVISRVLIDPYLNFCLLTSQRAVTHLENVRQLNER